MKQNKTEQTKVVFRKEPPDYTDVFAIFPEITWKTIDGVPYYSCYDHKCGHGPCHPSYINDTRPASPPEYANLLAELMTIGYDDIRVMKKIIQHKK